MSDETGWRKVGSAAALALALAAAACSAPRSSLPDANGSLASLQAAYAPDKVRDCLARRLTAQRPCRDEIAQSMLVAIDMRYTAFEQRLMDANRATGLGSWLVLTGIEWTKPLAGDRLAEVLSTIHGGVAGARESLDREMLAGRTLPELLTAMRAQRDAVAPRIQEGLSRSAERYPLGVALSDLGAYARAGTIAGAVGGTPTAATQRQVAQR